jgi:hypothetical protein
MQRYSAAREAELQSLLDAQSLRETALRAELEQALAAAAAAAATASDAAVAKTAAERKVGLCTLNQVYP